MSNLTGTLKNKNGDTLFPETVQMVTNGYGTGLKFADGTLMCYGNIEIPKPPSGTSNSVVVTFPVAFIDANYGFGYMQMLRTGSAEHAFFYSDNTKTSIRLYMWLQAYISGNLVTERNQPQTVRWMAVGRWR